MYKKENPTLFDKKKFNNDQKKKNLNILWFAYSVLR